MEELSIACLLNRTPEVGSAISRGVRQCFPRGLVRVPLLTNRQAGLEVLGLTPGGLKDQGIEDTQVQALLEVLGKGSKVQGTVQ